MVGSGTMPSNVLLRVLVGAVVLTAGCTVRPAAVDRGGMTLPPLDPGVWPGRDVVAMEAIRDATPGVVFSVVPNPEYVDQEAAARAAMNSSSLLIGVNRVVGEGLLRVGRRSGQWIPDPRPRRPQPVPGDRLGVPEAFAGLGLKANGLFTTSRTIEALRESGWDRVNVESWQIVQDQLRAAGAPLLPNIQTQRAYLDAGVPIHVPECWPTPTRGIIVHFNGLEGTPLERRVIERLGERGWLVASIDIGKSVNTPRSAEAKAALATLQERVLEEYRRGTPTMKPVIERGSRVESNVLVSPATREAVQGVTRELSRAAAPSFQLCSMEDVEPLARAIGAEVDQTLAGNAYAAEAVVQYADELWQRMSPGADALPVVVIGFSAGALAAPTAAVRLRESLGERVRAVVLIGGGCDLFALSQNSTIARGGIVLRCGREPARPDLVAAVGARYLGQTKLDPYFMAPRLRDRPVLQIHASLDTWVPARQGLLLWERLGQPDTIAVPAGHRVLFLVLPLMADRVADWLEANVSSGGGVQPEARP